MYDPVQYFKPPVGLLKTFLNGLNLIELSAKFPGLPVKLLSHKMIPGYQEKYQQGRGKKDEQHLNDVDRIGQKKAGKDASQTEITACIRVVCRDKSSTV